MKHRTTLFLLVHLLLSAVCRLVIAVLDVDVASKDRGRRVLEKKLLVACEAFRTGAEA